MKGLIKKDIANLASYKKTLLTVIVIIVVAATTSPNELYYLPTILTMMLGMIALSTFNYDEISKSDKYILTLPVSRKDIVKSRYLLSLGITLLSAILGVILTVILFLVLKEFETPELVLNKNLLLTTTTAGVLGFTLIQSIQIPCLYKYGAEKGRIWMFIMLFTIGLLGSGIGYLLVNVLNINLDLEAFLNSLTISIYLIIILFIVLLELISYKVALNIFKKKDY